MLETVMLLIATPFVAILSLFTLRRILFTFAILPGEDRKHSTPGNGHLPEVLILVPCREEAGMIAGLCQSLSQLDYPPECVQVVLIDDGSRDRTGLLMEQEAAERPGWHILQFSNTVGKASALNTALAKFSFGEIIYIFDADHRPEPEVLKQAVRYFYAPRVAAVTGFTKVLNPIASPSAFYSTVESYTNQLVTVRAKDRLELAPALLGSNCAYRREPLLACGSFREGAYSEDSDLTVTFYRAGYRVRFAEEAVSYQQVPQSVKGYLNQHIRWGRGLNDVARVHSRDLYQDRKLPLPLRLELLLFTAGYLDRIALISAVLLSAFSYLIGQPLWFLFYVIAFSLITPLAQIIVLFLKERMKPAMWVRLPFLPIFFALDIFAALRATLDTLLNRARLWKRTERVEISG